MIPYADIHERLMDTKWKALEDWGIVRPHNAEENRRRLRESRMNIEDIVATALDKPKSLSQQALQHPEVVSRVALATSETDASSLLDSAPALDSTFIKTASTSATDTAYLHSLRRIDG